MPGTEGLSQSYSEEISLSGLQSLVEYKEEYKDVVTEVPTEHTIPVFSRLRN